MSPIVNPIPPSESNGGAGPSGGHAEHLSHGKNEPVENATGNTRKQE